MKRTTPRMMIGTAGWSIPRIAAADFPEHGTHLQRYAQCFTAAEINSSFYRSHKPGTYARWAAAVPQGFRFAVKTPREITHERRLVGIVQPLKRFLSETAELGDKRGPIFVQLPPSLRFDARIASNFLDAVRTRYAGPLVCEPRHPTWFTEDADMLLKRFHVARVAADPAVVPMAKKPGGHPGLLYIRLHGSPEIYRSSYSAQKLRFVKALLSQGAPKAHGRWCIFDNTMLGQATVNARQLAISLGS